MINCRLTVYFKTEPPLAGSRLKLTNPKIIILHVLVYILVSDILGNNFINRKSLTEERARDLKPLTKAFGGRQHQIGLCSFQHQWDKLTQPVGSDLRKRLH